MEMKRYKRSLEFRCFRVLVVGIIVAAVWLLYKTPLKDAVPGLKSVYLSDDMSGFIDGALFSSFTLGVAYLIYMVILIKNPEALKRRYQKKCDERLIFICRQAGDAALRITILIVFAAMMVASAFSPVVVHTLCMIIFLIPLVYFCCRQYYKRKY